jgi:hypothetical protein
MIIQKYLFGSDSFNYTFNTCASVYGIIILHTIAQYYATKTLVVVLHISSLIGIIYINHEYYKHFRSNHFFAKPLNDKLLY